MRDLAMDEDAELVVLQMLVDEGALEIISIDEDGEPIYKVTEKCKEIFPELFYSHISEVNNIAFDLWNLGVIEIQFNEENHRVSFTKENFIKYVELKDTLTEDQINFLNAIIDKNILDNPQT
jgi:hypothetical protein